MANENIAFKIVLLILMSPVIITLMIVAGLSYADGDWPFALAYVLLGATLGFSLGFMDPIDEKLIAAMRGWEKFRYRLRSATFNMLPVGMVFGIFTAKSESTFVGALPGITQKGLTALAVLIVIELCKEYVIDWYKGRKARPSHS